MRGSIGRGTIFPSSAAAWLGARLLMQRPENADARSQVVECGSREAIGRNNDPSNGYAD